MLSLGVMICADIVMAQLRIEVLVYLRIHVYVTGSEQVDHAPVSTLSQTVSADVHSIHLSFLINSNLNNILVYQLLS